MARSVDEINSYMVNAFVSNFATIGITIDPTLWSKRNKLRLFIYAVAIGQALCEQLMDAFMALVEAQVAIAAAGSPLWLQAKMFEFQYSTTNPQYVTMINGVPQYPVVDTTLNIITACAIVSNVSGAVIIKCAQTVNGVLAALDNLMLPAAQGYINTIGTAGIGYTVQSKNPDQLYIAADIYFQGQQKPFILANMTAAITAWLQQQSVTNFNGAIKVSDLEVMMREVAGVNDIALQTVSARTDANPITASIQLVLNYQVINRQYNSDAGYMIPEQTTGYTLATSLNLIAQ